MNRRSILKLLGLSTAATVLSKVPAAAVPVKAATKASHRNKLLDCFADPLYADVHTYRDGKPHVFTAIARVNYQPSRGRRYADDLVVSFDANFTCKIERVHLRRGGDNPCWLINCEGNAMESPYVSAGMTVQVRVGIR